nr:MAG TPA: hypothetical protein [Caudoviricetes sp.]
MLLNSKQFHNFALLHLSVPLRYNSMYLISNLRLHFAYHNYIQPCRNSFGNFSPCVSAFT